MYRSLKPEEEKKLRQKSQLCVLPGLKKKKN